MAKAKKKGKKPKIDFEEISKELANMDHKQHIKDIEPSVTEEYLKHAKYKDSKGVIRYKTKFNKKEAKKMAHGIYDSLGYHSHRRVFGMDEETYKNLAKFKDPNGNPYIDSVTGFYFGGLKRKDMERDLSSDDENEITAGGLQKLLEDPMKKHASLLAEGIISKHGLDDPKHQKKVKGAIDKIVEKHKLSKKRFDTSKIYGHGDLLQLYHALSKEYCKDE